MLYSSGKKEKTFVDSLNDVPQPKRFVDPIVSSVHGCIRSACIQNKMNHQASGYILYDTGNAGNSEAPSYKYSKILYRHEYPYKIELPYDWRFKKGTKAIPDIGEGQCDGEFRSITRDKEYCQRVIDDVQAVLRKDGFTRFTLNPVPVYYSEIKHDYKMGLVKNRYFEEGRITNTLDGYVIQFSVQW